MAERLGGAARASNDKAILAHECLERLCVGLVLAFQHLAASCAMRQLPDLRPLRERVRERELERERERKREREREREREA